MQINKSFHIFSTMSYYGNINIHLMNDIIVIVVNLNGFMYVYKLFQNTIMCRLGP